MTASSSTSAAWAQERLSRLLPILQRRPHPLARRTSPEPPASQHPLRLSARSLSRPLGRAEACRRDHLFDLDGRRIASSHGLRRPPRGQGGDRCPERSTRSNSAPILTGELSFWARSGPTGVANEGQEPCPLRTVRYRLEAVMHAHDDCGACYGRTYAISIRVPVPPLSSRRR
jgi:hypothetical protein